MKKSVSITLILSLGFALPLSTMANSYADNVSNASTIPSSFTQTASPKPIIIPVPLDVFNKAYTASVKKSIMKIINNTKLKSDTKVAQIGTLLLNSYIKSSKKPVSTLTYLESIFSNYAEILLVNQGILPDDSTLTSNPNSDSILTPSPAPPFNPYPSFNGDPNSTNAPGLNGNNPSPSPQPRLGKIPPASIEEVVAFVKAGLKDGTLKGKQLLGDGNPGRLISSAGILNVAPNMTVLYTFKGNHYCVSAKLVAYMDNSPTPTVGSCFPN
jgi:hypothetical protein